MTVVLRLRETPEARVDAAALTPAAVAALSPAEIGALPLRHGRRATTVAELFDVDVLAGGDGGADLRVEGDLRRVDRLAEAMAEGSVELDGPVGDHVAARMAGGSVVVHGDAGAYAGAELRGGLLRIHGTVSDGLAAAYPGTRAGMRGGEVLVDGDAGEEVGAGMRRGLVAVGGRTGAGAGLRMLAGTVIALGGLGAEAGVGSRRGSLVSAAPVAIPSTYALACRYRPPALRLQLLHLRALGMAFEERLLDATWARWSGDRLELTRGEILMLDEGPR